MNSKALIGFLVAGMFLGGVTQTVSASLQQPISADWQGGGDDKKEKKNKEEKEEDGQKATKNKFSPRKAASLSAKDARKNLRWKEQAITNRAKTRNYFHRTFNTKFGKPVNFRNKFTRNRWRKGRI